MKNISNYNVRYLNQLWVQGWHLKHAKYLCHKCMSYIFFKPVCGIQCKTRTTIKAALSRGSLVIHLIDEESVARRAQEVTHSQLASYSVVLSPNHASPLPCLCQHLAIELIPCSLDSKRHDLYRCTKWGHSDHENGHPSPKRKEILLLLDFTMSIHSHTLMVLKCAAKKKSKNKPNLRN